MIVTFYRQYSWWFGDDGIDFCVDGVDTYLPELYNKRKVVVEFLGYAKQGYKNAYIEIHEPASGDTICFTDDKNNVCRTSVSQDVVKGLSKHIAIVNNVLRFHFKVLESE